MELNIKAEKMSVGKLLKPHSDNIDALLCLSYNILG